MYLVVGLGITGQSVLRFFHQQGEPCLAFDTRADFDLTSLVAAYPEMKFAKGHLPSEWSKWVETVVLSPGVAKSEAWLDIFKAANIPIIGDIELFARASSCPIVAITGSNGKSTVTTLVSEVLKQAGYSVGMGGNIGVPALDLLTGDSTHDVYVLELSSFQLETTYSLHTVSATVLNISEDHMDRYEGLNDYLQAKMTILNDTEWSVLPVELKESPNANRERSLHFGYFDGAPLTENQYGVIHCNDEDWLGYGQSPLVRVKDMALQARHHQLNALATLALCRPFNLAASCFQTVLSRFKGLPHRTQKVAEIDGVAWINDSKGTNVGATLAAMKSLAMQAQGKLILLAGGVGKDADFSLLRPAVDAYCRHVFLFGRDSAKIAQHLAAEKTTELLTLKDAVTQARRLAQPGDIVLFSPACASFDQFDNYVARGEAFEAMVNALPGTKKDSE